jgi:L-fuculose-phosphate aldolase
LISAAEGNLSVRLDGERILVTPSGRRKDELEADDLVLVRIGHPAGGAEGEVWSRSGLAPTSDLRIHLAVHKARPELGAVAHAHLPASMALTLAGEIPDPAVLPETAFHLPRLPYLPYGEMGSAELAARVAAALSDGPPPIPDAVLLERHGAVAVGADVASAVDRLELIEVLCRTWRDALVARAARATLARDGIVEWPSNPVAPTHQGRDG